MSKAVVSILSVGVILFIALFFYFKWKKFKTKFDALKIPPWVSECPDYWAVERKGVCRNTHNLGKCAHDTTLDFNGPSFRGRDGDLQKCRLAHHCNVSWTGIDHQCR